LPRQSSSSRIRASMSFEGDWLCDGPLFFTSMTYWSALIVT
jgi:hypothetical protein